MYLLSWIIVGLIIGWSTGKHRAAGGYGPIMELAGVAGAAGGGFVTGLTCFANGTKRYA